MSKYDHDVVIAGGGIVGLATAVALCRAGVGDVQIFEKAESMRPVGAAIGLFPNGLRALYEISPRVQERVLASAITTSRYITCDLDGNIVRDREGRGNTTLLVWYLLQQYLADELPEKGMLALSARVANVEQDDDCVRVHVVENGEERVVRCRVLVGADGIWSCVRSTIFGATKPPRYHGKFMFRSVLPRSELNEEVCPPAGTQHSFAGEEKGKLFALRETAKGLVTVTAMARMEDDKVLLDAEEKRARLKQVFKEYPAHVQEVIERMDADCIFEHAVYDVEEVLPRWSQGRVVLVGDAVHAMTPGLGQGANQGLEDACELAHFLSRVMTSAKSDKKNIESALERFWSGRLDRVREIHALSREKTAAVNESTLESRKASDSSMKKLDDYRERVYGWHPTALIERNRMETLVKPNVVAVEHQGRST